MRIYEIYHQLRWLAPPLLSSTRCAAGAALPEIKFSGRSERSKAVPGLDAASASEQKAAACSAAAATQIVPHDALHTVARRRRRPTRLRDRIRAISHRLRLSAAGLRRGAQCFITDAYIYAGNIYDGTGEGWVAARRGRRGREQLQRLHMNMHVLS